MRRGVPVFLAVLCLTPAVARAQGAPASAPVAHVSASYDAYAAGLQVAEMQARVALDPAAYRMRLSYHTTGLLGALAPGRQDGGVDGLWERDRASPQRFWGNGVWRGADRRTEMVFHGGQPEVVELVPPNDADLEPVPAEMQAGTIDSLTAMAQVLRQVAATGRCEGTARTFDGRRVVALTVRTVGQEDVEPSSRSPFAGRALRCDFEGRQLAGFYRGADRAELEKPKPGSAWFAPVVAGAPPLPIRITFPTRFVGEGTLYLTSAQPDTQVMAKP